MPYVHRANYLPDFVLPNGIVIEGKGYLKKPDRKKLCLIREQHPEIDLRLVVGRASAKVQGLTITIAEWADKFGIPWAVKEVPEAWISERPKKARVAAIERFRW